MAVVPRTIIQESPVIDTMRLAESSLKFSTMMCTCVLAAAMSVPGGRARAEASDLVLWYNQPAAAWTEALPVGNGRLGAMVFGQTARERLQFNEDTLWAGSPRDYSHPGAAEYLPQIRQLIFDGRQAEAEALAMEKMMSVPLRQFPYQPFGDLTLEFPGHEKSTAYRRDLDLDCAVARVRYDLDGVEFQREVFASAVDQVIVVRLSASRPGCISVSTSLTSPHPAATARADGQHQLILTGKVSEYRMARTSETFPSALRFESRLAPRVEGGTVSAVDGRLVIHQADTVTLLLAAATSYGNFRDVSADPAQRCARTLDQAAAKDYATLRRDHVADHQRLFRRVHLDLGVTAAAELPTDQRVVEFAAQPDPQLATLFFQFGRYLLIASSRPGSQPANLQGIWNDRLDPPWDSKWTTNINTEMNYWPAEVTNLSECHEPLFDLLSDVAITGRQTAHVHYGCRGWVLHHNTDIWRGTAPINNSNHGIWPTGGAWLCQHLWDHYLFTQDKEFLARRAYPLMKEAALFFVDFLVADPKSGYLISCPSNSPEHGGLVAGPTMDHQIIRSLFAWCIEAAEVLQVDAEFREQLRQKRTRIAPNTVAADGQLQEWVDPQIQGQPRHRHVSHLWGLHPGWEITPRETPELAEACRVSLQQRGDDGTGWSLAWKISLWARLADGDHAARLLAMQLTPRRTYPNLFDICPPFQIDGNFGATAGIAEMLLQSHTGQIELLPALPRSWPAGSVRGLVARGGYVVDMAWNKERLTTASLVAHRAGTCVVRYGEKTVRLTTQPGQRYEVSL